MKMSGIKSVETGKFAQNSIGRREIGHAANAAFFASKNKSHFLCASIERLPVDLFKMLAVNHQTELKANSAKKSYAALMLQKQ